MLRIAVSALLNCARWFVLVTVLIGALAGCEQPSTMPPGFKPGTHWYAIELHGVHAGYARLQVSAADRLGVDTEFRLLQANDGVAEFTRWRIRETYDPVDPWPLVTRVSETVRNGFTERTEILRSEAGHYEQDGRSLALEFTLRDRLGTLAGDATLETRQFAEDSGRLEGTSWSTSSGSDTGRSVVLGADGVPQEIRMGASLRMRHTSRAEATAIAGPALRTALELPIDQPLGDPTTLSEVRLRFTGIDPGRFVQDARQQIVATSNGVEVQITGAGRRAQQTGVPGIPRGIAAAARAARSTAPALARAERLVNWTHHRLDWDEKIHPLNSTHALQLGSGSCSAFAAVFADVAAAAELPVRTVIGLVYRGDDQQSMALHSWNEVQVGTVWRAVDPTWNQIQVDPTHIAFVQDHGDQWLALEELRASTVHRVSFLRSACAEPDC